LNRTHHFARETENDQDQPKDHRFGLSWQIAPTRLLELVPATIARPLPLPCGAMFEMKKIVIADIERAVRPDHH
jgi:predicted 3-demethylubiquinone-9 3-methyltransferase (glyoxalase superfamily)